MMDKDQVTPGTWYYAEGSYGSPGGRYEPPAPGYPPIIYTEVEVTHRDTNSDIDGASIYDVIIAEMHEPVYHVDPNPEDEYDDGTRHYEGNADANAKFITTACNAAKEINPKHPQAAAEAIVEMWQAINDCDTFFRTNNNFEDGDCETFGFITKVREAIAKAQRRRPGVRPYVRTE